MPYNPDIHHRRSTRLKGFDYTQPGSYFVTICTYQRHCLFGGIVDSKMKLNTNSEIARACWLSIPRHFLNVQLDEFVVMPNHLHGIITIVKGEALAMKDSQHQSTLSRQCFSPTSSTFNTPKGTKPKSSPAIIQNFKAVSTRQINRINGSKGNIIWQRDYYEHIIRDEKSLNNIRQYIIDNPLNWAEDKYRV